MIEDKIESAHKILMEADSIAQDGFKFVLFSGGKDSIVVSHMASNLLGIKNGFNEESLVPPYLKKEIYSIENILGLDVNYSCLLTPEKFVKHWKNQIPPKKWKPSNLDSVRHWKSIPAYAKKTDSTMMIFGRRQQENNVPKPIYYKKNFKPLQVHPIWNWTLSDVWSYIKKYDLPYPSCYDDGYNHLLTWVSLAQKKWNNTNNMIEVYEVINKHAPEYMEAMKEYNPYVKKYLEL